MKQFLSLVLALLVVVSAPARLPAADVKAVERLNLNSSTGIDPVARNYLAAIMVVSMIPSHGATVPPEATMDDIAASLQVPQLPVSNAELDLMDPQAKAVVQMAAENDPAGMANAIARISKAPITNERRSEIRQAISRALSGLKSEDFSSNDPAISSTVASKLRELFHEINRPGQEPLAYIQDAPADREESERAIQILPLKNVSRSHFNTLQRAPDVDLLTGFKTRAALERAVVVSITTRNRDVLIMDIDHFGMFNRLLGPHRTDHILSRFADILYFAVRASGHRGDIYRLGGEEIAVVVEKGRGEQFARNVNYLVRNLFISTLREERLITAQERRDLERELEKERRKLVQSVESPNRGPEKYGTVSIGISSLSALPRSATAKERLDVFGEAMFWADAALKGAKEAGRDRIATVNTDYSIEILTMRTGIFRRSLDAIESKFRRAGNDRRRTRSDRGLRSEQHRIQRILEALEDLGTRFTEARLTALRFLVRDHMTPLWGRSGMLLLADRILAQYTHLAALEIVGFKDVNDVVGHKAGDELLRAWGEELFRLSAGLAISLVRRFGKEYVAFGDENDMRDFLDRVKAVNIQNLLARAGISKDDRSNIESHLQDRYVRANRKIPGVVGSLLVNPGEFKDLLDPKAATPAATLETAVDKLRLP